MMMYPPQGGGEFADNEEGSEQTIKFFITKFNKDLGAKGTVIAVFEQRKFDLIMDYINLLPSEQEAALTDNQKKKLFFNTHPKTWQEAYNKSAHWFFDDATIEEIRDYVCICENIADARQKEDQKKKEKKEPDAIATFATSSSTHMLDHIREMNATLNPKNQASYGNYQLDSGGRFNSQEGPGRLMGRFQGRFNGDQEGQQPESHYQQHLPIQETQSSKHPWDSLDPGAVLNNIVKHFVQNFCNSKSNEPIDVPSGADACKDIAPVVPNKIKSIQGIPL
eukprot:jgi/Psemu1/11869/gm1.11869_g